MTISFIQTNVNGQRWQFITSLWLFLPCADIESTPAYLIKSAVKSFIVQAPTCQHEWN